jgi:hypothetical protein
MEAKRRWAIYWLARNDLDRPYHATKAMSEMIESHGWNLVSSGRKVSSHSGHKTGVSVLDALTEGKSRSKIMEWMLVTDWLDAAGHLCTTIRFVKCWVTGQQKIMGKRRLIKRVGRDSIPHGGSTEHPRSRAFAISMEAKSRTAICWLPGTVLGLIRPPRRCRR